MDTSDIPTTDTPTPEAPTADTPTAPPPDRALRRSADSHVIAGVAMGIARYRGLGIPIYLACWLLIPVDGAQLSIAEDLMDRDWGHSFSSAHHDQ
jgi:phage shock protein PspC (stress-responsive transcriptional regulator)